MDELFFSGNILDRSSELRNNKEWLDQAWIDTNTKVLLFRNCEPLVDCTNEELELCTFEPGLLNTLACSTDSEKILLGRDRSNGTVWFAINLSKDTSLEGFRDLLQPNRRFTAGRFELLNLTTEHGSLVSQAKSMFHWLDRYRFCSSCGGTTRSDEAGYKRTCVNNSCKSNKGVHNTCYPRTDPTVIMCVVSSDGKQCLLGRKATFPPKWYSCLAGFMEPGESIEDAVIRETKEESGIDVSDIHYVASQPWPFPSSLMIGCIALATSREITVCELEMQDVQWFDKKVVKQALLKQSDVLRIPPKQAMAHQLIRHWVEKGHPKHASKELSSLYSFYNF